MLAVLVHTSSEVHPLRHFLRSYLLALLQLLNA